MLFISRTQFKLNLVDIISIRSASPEKGFAFPQWQCKTILSLTQTVQAMGIIKRSGCWLMENKLIAFIQLLSLTKMFRSRASILCIASTLTQWDCSCLLLNVLEAITLKTKRHNTPWTFLTGGEIFSFGLWVGLFYSVQLGGQFLIYQTNNPKSRVTLYFICYRIMHSSQNSAIWHVSIEWWTA